MHLIERYAPEEIYMPTMVPDGLIEPFEKNEIPVYRYPLKPDFSPDLDFLNTYATGIRRKIFVVVCYFGYPMPTAEAAALAHYRNGLLLLDCAHSLFHPDADNNCADLILYSLNKTLPVPDGAMLVSTTPSANLKAPKDLKPLDDDAIHAYLNHLAMNRLVAKIDKWNFYAKAANDLGSRYYDDYYHFISSDMSPRQISPISRLAYETMDFKAISDKRRSNAQKIISRLRRRALYREDAPDFALPIRCEPGSRDDVFFKLREEGILATHIGKRWRPPFDSEKLMTSFWENHLLLPVNHDLTAADVNKIGKEARRWT